MADKTKKQKLSSAVESLQESLIRVMTATLERKACEACGATPCSAADVSNVRQFLKDNGFVVDPVRDSDALDRLIGTASGQAKYPPIGDPAALN